VGTRPSGFVSRLPNGLELSCPAETGNDPLIVAHAGGPGTPPYGPARRVSFSELLGAKGALESYGPGITSVMSHPMHWALEPGNNLYLYWRSSPGIPSSRRFTLNHPRDPSTGVTGPISLAGWADQ